MIKLARTEMLVQFVIKSDNDNAVEDILKLLSALWLMMTYISPVLTFLNDILQSLVFVNTIIGIRFSSLAYGFGLAGV